MGDADLFVNLVIAITAALIGAVVAARLRQSIIVGYILAGVVISPLTPGVESDYATVEQLANIGIVLLLFAIGVQFSLSDLLSAGKVALLGAGVQVVIMIAIGFAVGLAIGWDPMEALFFGAVLSNSSSTVLSKVLGERGEMDTSQGGLALAWSTVQDLSTVILIVVLSALATDSDELATDLLIEAAKAGLFLALLVPIGLRVLPWLFERAAELRNREIFVLTVGAVALGLAWSSTLFGLSLALGAFVVGVVVSESDLSHQILGEVLPLRDIFAGLFFVSVGMLVDPGFVLGNLPLLLLTVVLIVLVKGPLSAAIAWMLGTPTRVAVLAGAALAQCAEFSFLLARVGRDVGALSSDGYSLMLAGSAVSIMLLPTTYRFALPVADALQAWRPAYRLDDDPPEIANPAEGLRGHAVICGYGRVGTVIGYVLRRRFTVVAIEEDIRVVRALRAREVPVVRGNAAMPAVLRQAQLERARALVVAVPDPLVVRQVVDQARQMNPRLRIVARTHSEAERQWLLARGVDSVILGEWELALEMTAHALRGFGVSSTEAEAIVQRLRGQSDLRQVREDLARSTPPKPAPAAPAAASETPAEHPQRRLHDGVRFREDPSPAPRASGDEPELV